MRVSHIHRYMMRWSMLLFLSLAATGATIPGQFIVELDSAPAAGMRNGAARTHRARLRTEHDTMRTRLSARRAQVFGETETVLNSVFVQLDGDDALRQLRATPGVKRVYPVREFRRVLDRIVLTHKAVDVWAQVGESRAGEGIKVGVIDSGIDVGHPALKGEGFTAPEGFPKVTNDSDLAYTNGKVIVARSYVSLLSRRDPDNSVRDRVGHGTALAAIIAGARTVAPLATIAGMAPRARIGVYKVFGSPNVNDATSEAALLRAMDDAVADGMDVINLSLGSDLATRFEDDPLVAAVERASREGVLVIAAAGNNGPGLNTLNSPGTAPSAITVGAVSNSRNFATGVEVPGLGVFTAVNSSGATATAPITGTVADVAALDRNGLGCEALPAGSLSGRVALMMRGTCTFVVKLTNAQNAGAVAAIVYATAEEPDPFIMGTGSVQFPAQMVSNGNGLAIKEAAAGGGIVATLHLSPGPVEIAGGRRTSFSSAGPNVDASIKPEIVATGGQVYTATQTIDPAGDMYSPNGFLVTGGTSFSTPVVAGAAALLKAARPGLTVEQYRSLLINTATAAFGRQGETAGAQQIGAGTLDALAAVNASVAAFPATLGFGVGGSEFDHRRNLTLTNLGTAADTFTIEAESTAASVPVADTVRIEPGATVQVPVRWTASGVTPAAYEGFLNVRSLASGQAIRVPYWYDATDNKPAAITILAAPSTARPGATLRGALQFRVLDAAGVAINSVEPEVLAEVGDGSARTPVSLDEVYPGVYQTTLSMGPAAGVHRFRVKAGEASTLVSITVQ